MLVCMDYVYASNASQYMYRSLASVVVETIRTPANKGQATIQQYKL